MKLVPQTTRMKSAIRRLTEPLHKMKQKAVFKWKLNIEASKVQNVQQSHAKMTRKVRKQKVKVHAVQGTHKSANVFGKLFKPLLRLAFNKLKRDTNRIMKNCLMKILRSGLNELTRALMMWRHAADKKAASRAASREMKRALALNSFIHLCDRKYRKNLRPAFNKLAAGIA